jgi:site-specific DNA-cytosine methylase
MIAIVRAKQRQDIVWATRAAVTTIDANYSAGPGYAGNRTQAGRIDGGILRARQLTPLEAERCQGLPDQWTAGLSRHQRFRQIGNSIVPNVVAAIILRLFEGQGIEPSNQP